MPMKSTDNWTVLLTGLLVIALACSFTLTSCSTTNSTSRDCPGPSYGTCICGSGAACPAILNEYLYASSGSGEVLTFSVTNSTGALSPIGTVSGPANKGIAQVGEFLFVSDSLHGQLDGFAIGQPGTLSVLSGSPFTAGNSANPQGLASPSGSYFLYAADNGAIDAFTVNSSSGVPTSITGSPFASGTNSYLAVGSYGAFLYSSVDDAPGGIFGFAIASTGALSEIPGSPFLIPGQKVANSQPAGIVANQSYVYAALSGSNQIAAFSINGTTGALTPLANSPVAAGAIPTELVLTDAFLYALNSGDGTISGYSWNSSTGLLTPAAGSPFAISGTTLASDSFGQYLYVSGASGIQAYSIDGNTGNLTAVSGSPFAASAVVGLIGLDE